MDIGTVVGYMVTLQKMLYTHLPIDFPFPWQYVLVVFVCSMLFGLLSAYKPIKTLLKQPLVELLTR